MILLLLPGMANKGLAIHSYPYPKSSAGTLNLEWYSQLDFDALTLKVSSDDKIYIVGDSTTANYSLRKYTTSGTEEWCRPINWVYKYPINAIYPAIYFDSFNNIFIFGRADENYWMVNHWVTRTGPLFIIKCNSEGILQWYRFWRLDEDEGMHKVSFAFDSSNNIYASGSAYLDDPEFNTDVFLLKYSTSGTLLWNKTWGTYTYEYKYDFCFSLTIDSSNNVYVLWTADNENDLFISKYDQSGISIWNETISNIFSNFDWGYSFYKIYCDNTGNLIIIGETTELGEGLNDIILIKYNTNGDFIWYETWGGTQNENWRDLKIDSLNNLFIVGTTESFGIDEEIFLLKYDQSGDLVWNETWGGPGDDLSTGMMWIDTSNIINLIGTTNSDLVILQYDKLGVYQNHFTWDPEDLGLERCWGIPDSSNNLFSISFTRKFKLEGEDILFKLSLGSSNGDDGDDGDNNGTMAIPGYQIPLLISIFITLVIVLVRKKRNLN